MRMMDSMPSGVRERITRLEAAKVVIDAIFETAPDELCPRDINLTTGMLTVTRAVVHISPKIRPEGKRFYSKQYPKDRRRRT